MFCSIVVDIKSSPFLIRIHDAYPKHDSSPQKLKFYLIDSDLRVTDIETNESIVNMYNPILILAILCFLLSMRLLMWM